MVGRAGGNHADVSLPDSIKAFVFACHMRVPACAMTCTVAVTTLECRGFTPVSVFLHAYSCPLVTKWPAAQQDLPVVGLGQNPPF